MYSLIGAVFDAAPRLKERGLTGTEVSVLAALANRTNSETLRCDPGTKCLSEDTCWDEKTIDRAVKNLALAGVISYVPRGGKYNTNDYTIFHEVHPDDPKRLVLTPRQGPIVARGRRVPGTISPKARDFESEGEDFGSEGGDFGSKAGDSGTHKSDNQKNQEEPERTNQAAGSVGQSVASVSSVSHSGVPGARPVTITNPAELHARRWQQAKTKTPASTASTPAAAPAGPAHPLAAKFLGNVGATAALRKKGPAWDSIATELQRTHPLDDLLAAVDWIWGDHCDGWWATKITERHTDPFEFFAAQAEKILDQHQRLLNSQAREAKRNSNLEAQNDRNNDSIKYNPVSSW